VLSGASDDTFTLTNMTPGGDSLNHVVISATVTGGSHAATVP